MNYGDFKDEIIGLGFSDEAELEEFGTIVPNAINRAIAEIGETFPIYGSYEFSLEKEDENRIEINMPEADSRFLEFREATALYQAKDRSFKVPFNDYTIERGDTFVMDATPYEGDFTIYYSRAMRRYTLDSKDSIECELPLKTHRLVPLLASYYIWLEDDPTKATQYYNAYEQKIGELTQSTIVPRARILEGGI